ncbi:Gamma-glutamyl-gamma-aminobutyrate hydrolase PuuD [compost metagenome]
MAHGGTLYQDLALHHPQGGDHHDPDAYDQHFHEVALVAGAGLARIYPGRGRARVNSIHHQGIRDLGKDLACEAVSVPDQVVEAIRWKGAGYVLGVQWHPEFHDPANPDLLDGEPLLREFLQHAESAREGVSRNPAASPTATAS